MATKSLTITEESYNLLKSHKLDSESFSEEIKRIFSEKKKRPLKDFFGILSEDEGDQMLKDLEQIKKMNLNLLREKSK